MRLRQVLPAIVCIALGLSQPGAAQFAAPSPPSVEAPYRDKQPETKPGTPPVLPEFPQAEPSAAGTVKTGGEYKLTAPGGLVYDVERALAVARGPVTLEYGGFSVKGDKGVVDFNRRIATLTGKLQVKAEEREFSGRTLTFHLDTDRWELSPVEAVISPESFPDNSVLEPIFLTGGKVSGTAGKVTGQDFKVSSCDRGHYYLLSREVRFYREKSESPQRIVLKRNSLSVFGRRLMPLPVFSINMVSATSRRVPLQPVVGQNSSDGVFVKTTYTLGANKSHTDTLLLDALQKRGMALGFTRELADGAGLFSYYRLAGRGGNSQTDARINRLWKITPALNATLNYQSSQGNSFGFANKSSNADLSLDWNRADIRSNLLLRMSSSGSGAESFSDLGASWQHHQKFGSMELDAANNYSRNEFGALGESATLDNTVLLSWRQKRMDTFLRAENHDDLTGTVQKNGAYQLERLPELGFLTDTNRTYIPGLSKWAPGDIGFTFGEYNEPTSQQKLFRTLLNYSLRPVSWQLARRGKFTSRLDLAGRFEQAFYSNDTARYNYETFLNWDSQSGPLNLRVAYLRQRFRGFTPFQFDFLFPGETLDANLNYRLGERLLAEISSGQDFENNFARDVTAQLKLQSKTKSYLGMGASFSRQTGDYGDFVLNAHLERPSAKLIKGNMDIGLRYAPTLGMVTRVNLAGDLYANQKTRLQAIASYNGFTKGFDFSQIRVTRDLHCFNLYGTYDSQRKEFRLDLALKAFPFVDTRYGRTGQGAGFNPFVGEFR